MSGNWSDLRARVLSAIVMVAVGAGAIWAGGVVFETMVVLAGAAMLWELGRMIAPAPRLRLAALVYALVILLACLSLILLELRYGITPILWLVGVVVASDVAGYFAGRSLGGPKFWPAISPKKTWSGTIAGWVGAALVGLGFVLAGQGGWALVVLSPFVAFAGQMGDITESWFKRRAGVKDASNLIPGHGGVLDRFDALIFAAVLVGGIALVAPGALGG
jgi:phosphatidate cytidylyltransferase